MTAQSASTAASALSLWGRLGAYLLICGCYALAIAPLATGYSSYGRGMEASLHRLGTTAWTAQVLVLVAVLTLAVPGRVLAFQFALLAALLQGYIYVSSGAIWQGLTIRAAAGSDTSFAVTLGLCATLSAIFWLLVRLFGKLTLSGEAAEEGRRGQFGLRELLYVVASLSALLGFVSLFSFPGLMPTEMVLLNTLLFGAQVLPVVVTLFWAAATPRFHYAGWIWAAVVTVCWIGASVYLEFVAAPWFTWRYELSVFFAALLGYVGVVLANALVLHLLALTWRRGGESKSGATHV